jgi:hypothetical protein
VPTFLQTSSLGFFSRRRFQLEQFSICQPRDGSQYFSERDICAFNHVAFHRGITVPLWREMLRGDLGAVNGREIRFPLGKVGKFKGAPTVGHRN